MTLPRLGIKTIDRKTWTASYVMHKKSIFNDRRFNLYNGFIRSLRAVHKHFLRLCRRSLNDLNRLAQPGDHDMVPFASERFRKRQGLFLFPMYQGDFFYPQV
jgi:hypothetical protein